MPECLVETATVSMQALGCFYFDVECFFFSGGLGHI